MLSFHFPSKSIFRADQRTLPKATFFFRIKLDKRRTSERQSARDTCLPRTLWRLSAPPSCFHEIPSPPRTPCMKLYCLACSHECQKTGTKQTSPRYCNHYIQQTHENFGLVQAVNRNVSAKRASNQEHTIRQLGWARHAAIPLSSLTRTNEASRGTITHFAAAEPSGQ